MNDSSEIKRTADTKADLLTSHAFALLLGVTAETLIAAADDAAAGKPPRKRAIPLPSPVLTLGGAYRWRPALVVPYLIQCGHAVPEGLIVRAKRDGWTPPAEKGTR